MVGRKHTDEEKRLIVAEYVASRQTLTEFSKQAGVCKGTLGHWAIELYSRGDLDPFTFSPKLSACPVMAYAVHLADPRAREYVRAAYMMAAELYPGEDGAPLNEDGRSVVSGIAKLAEGASPGGGVSPDGLRALWEGSSRCKAVQMRAAVFAALETGFHTAHPFFAWASENEALLREKSAAAAVIAEALEDDGFRHMRIVEMPDGEPYVYGCDCSGIPFCSGLLDGFMASPRLNVKGSASFFCGHFAESLGFVPESLADFTPATFGRQLEWLRDNCPTKRERDRSMRACRALYMHLLDLLPDDQTAFTFETGLPPRGLAYKDISRRWLEGYRCAVHEPLDPVPPFAKAIVFPNADEALNSSINEAYTFLFDFGMGDREMEEALMRWVWQEDSLLATSRFFRRTKDLAEDISRGGRGAGGILAVRPDMVRRALPGRGSAGPAKLHLRRFLSFCEDEGYLDVQPGCWLLLETTRSEREQRGAEVGAVSEEHLAMLARKLEEAAGRSLADELAYVAFAVQSLTDLRASEVLSIRVADLDAGPRNGVKAIRVCRKTSGKGFRKVQVTEEIHRLLQAAARITEPVRESADRAIAHYLFLCEGQMGCPSVMSRDNYARHIAAACDELAIPRVVPANIRKRYMTTGVEEGLRAGISRLALRSITGHADLGSDPHYLRPDIMSRETREYLEGAFLVEIGELEPRGEVLSDCELRADVSALVEGGAGVCRSEKCNVAGSVPCLMCAGFATSPRYIPEMLDAIATLDERIRRASPHDREHLLEAKCAYLAYLGKMIDKEKEEQDG